MDKTILRTLAAGLLSLAASAASGNAFFGGSPQPGSVQWNGSSDGYGYAPAPGWTLYPSVFLVSFAVLAVSWMLMRRRTA